MKNEFIPIYYGGFWNVPSAFFTTYSDKLWFFFRDYFDEELDDYPPNYSVYFLNNISLDEAIKTEVWEPASFKELEFVAEIPTRLFVFDETKKKFINTSTLDSLYSNDN